MVGKTILIIIGFALVTLILYFSYRVDEKRKLVDLARRVILKRKRMYLTLKRY